MKPLVKLSVLLSVLSFGLTACQPTEFAEKEVLAIEAPQDIQVIHDSCLSARTEEDCLGQGPSCQPAYEDSEGESRIFACIPHEPKDSDEVNPVTPSEPVPMPPFNAAPGLPISIINEDDCKNLDSRFFVGNGKGQKKIAICHSLGGNPRTIVVACPALKAHLDHGIDTLGPCSLD